MPRPATPPRIAPALLILLFIPPGCGSRLGSQAVRGVPNFGTVTETDTKLYRGAQPTPAGLDNLRHEKHVAAFIDLRQTGGAVEKERRHVERMNPSFARLPDVEFVSIPSSCSSPNTRDLKHFVLEVRRLSAEGKPIFVHCRQGKDRTGLFVAVYEMVELNKSKKQALTELKGYGHGWPVCQEIDAYLHNFDPAKFRQDLDH